ncbi:hypothetical protein GSI_03375 [Ganoderma sinense ZZ0214-1]|uniref:Uncharacterized protein n=1 Tax=Ganoderma sinense ZZ0214-1 TaxID=1077348 RepID=A0A2G8SLD4_9APHY|nr:hypothetical protein GSI_03375 [Ganoderma sinense ZZ0214-1]
MATTTVRAKPARTTSKRASSATATANVSSNTTLTLRLNLNAGADARSRATSLSIAANVNNATQRAKPQGGQTKAQNSNGRPAAGQTTSTANTVPRAGATASGPRAQQTRTTRRAGATNGSGSGNGHNNAPRPGPQQQRQRQPGSGWSTQTHGARPGNGNGGNGYIPRPTSTPRQQPSGWQDAQVIMGGGGDSEREGVGVHVSGDSSTQDVNCEAGLSGGTICDMKPPGFLI